MLAWPVSICLVQTILGARGLMKGLWRVWIFPVTLLKMAWGFIRDSRRLVSKARERLPSRTLFLLSLPISILAGMTETNSVLLNVLLAIIVVQLILLLWACFRWTLNPIRFFEKLKVLETTENQDKILAGLIKVETPNPTDAKAKILERLKMLESGIKVMRRLLRWLAGPQLLFTVFIIVCLIGGTFSVLSTATVLRIMDQLSVEPLFAGKFFTGAWSDYLYVAANRFVSADLDGIEVASVSVRWVLTALPYISMTLIVFLILAFSTVSQSRTERSMTKLGDAAIDLIQKATQQIVEKPEVILIEAKGTAKPVSVESSVTVKPPDPPTTTT